MCSQCLSYSDNSCYKIRDPCDTGTELTDED